MQSHNDGIVSNFLERSRWIVDASAVDGRAINGIALVGRETARGFREDRLLEIKRRLDILAAHIAAMMNTPPDLAATGEELLLHSANAKIVRNATAADRCVSSRRLKKR